MRMALKQKDIRELRTDTKIVSKKHQVLVASKIQL